ncbi:MAG: hypothetical protein ACI30B_03755 [Paludibacteraceae bacterium]
MDLDIVIQNYIKRGFGSMTKNDFEVWIFGTLLQMQEYKGKSNYELSILLRIPETKVKRLRYESALKNVNPNTVYKEEVYKLLDKVLLRVNDKKIVFQVEDIMIKSYISSILKQNGRMLDSSFNQELIVLHIDDFQYLARAVYPNGKVEEVLKESKKLLKKSTKKEITWHDVMGWVVEGAVSGVASGATSAVATNLTPLGIIGIIKRGLEHKKQIY